MWDRPVFGNRTNCGTKPPKHAPILSGTHINQGLKVGRPLSTLNTAWEPIPGQWKVCGGVGTVLVRTEPTEPTWTERDRTHNLTPTRAATHPQPYLRVATPLPAPDTASWSVPGPCVGFEGCRPRSTLVPPPAGGPNSQTHQTSLSTSPPTPTDHPHTSAYT